jgi:hypothetical protein
MSLGYVKFDGDKLAEKRMVAVSSSEREPTREELGDTDQNRWKLDVNNKPKDPWQRVFEIPAVEVDGEKRQVIFTGSNKGAEIAWKKLYNAICRQIDQHPGKLPVVKLSTDKFKGKFGLVQRPDYEITGWVANGDGNGLVVDEDEFDDDVNDIPFDE